MKSRWILCIAWFAAYAVGAADVTVDWTQAKPFTAAWPAGKFVPQAEGALLRISTMESAGKFVLPLKPLLPAGEVPTRVRFEIRMISGAPGKQEIHLKEDGESFFKVVSLSGEWVKQDLPLSSFVLYPYGNAPVNDGKLDPAKVSAITFGGFTGKRVVEIRNFTIQSRLPGAANTVAIDWTQTRASGAAWPAGKFEPETDGALLRLSTMKQAGHYSIPLAPLFTEGEVPAVLSFEIRMTEGKPGVQEIHLKENNESYFKTVKLTGDWVRYEWPISAFELYTYGKAAVGDRKLNPAEIQRLTFGEFTGERVVEIRNMVIKTVAGEQKKMTSSSGKSR